MAASPPPAGEGRLRRHDDPAYREAMELALRHESAWLDRLAGASAAAAPG